MKPKVLFISLSTVYPRSLKFIHNLPLRGLNKGLCLLNIGILLHMLRETTMLISIWCKIYSSLFFCFYLPLVFELESNGESDSLKMKSFEMTEIREPFSHTLSRVLYQGLGHSCVVNSHLLYQPLSAPAESLRWFNNKFSNPLCCSCFLKSYNFTYHAVSLYSCRLPSFSWLIKLVGNWPELHIKGTWRKSPPHQFSPGLPTGYDVFTELK